MQSELFSALQPARMAARDDSSSGRRPCSRFKRPKRRRRCRRNRRRSRTATDGASHPSQVGRAPAGARPALAGAGCPWTAPGGGWSRRFDPEQTTPGSSRTRRACRCARSSSSSGRCCGRCAWWMLLGLGLLAGSSLIGIAEVLLFQRLVDDVLVPADYGPLLWIALDLRRPQRAERDRFGRRRHPLDLGVPAIPRQAAHRHLPSRAGSSAARPRAAPARRRDVAADLRRRLGRAVHDRPAHLRGGRGHPARLPRRSRSSGSSGSWRWPR